MTGIDTENTYIYLLEEASDRTSETWETYMHDRKERGLDLKVSITDGGTGLLSGIPKVYPEAELQRDVFHALYEMGKEVSKVERKAYACILEEYKLTANLAGKRPRQSAKEKLAVIKPKTKEAIDCYDTINILYGWLKELLSFSGYNKEDTLLLIKYVLQEMENIAPDYSGIKKETEKIRKNLPSLLSFINRLDSAMEKRAQELGIPLEAFRIMYRQMSYSPSSAQSNEMVCQLVEMLMERLPIVMNEFQILLNSVKKTSSLVENLNGRIRVYIEMKRVVPTRFFVLLKVYFNTRRYKRSRCKERVGKSPLELLMGTPQPTFFEALSY